MFLPCRPCCAGCGVQDGKPRTDPKDEGTWVPSGTWTGVGGVTWTFVPNPGDESGETWFFYGSINTSKPGGGATIAEQRDWGNICNWYSNKTTTLSSTSSLTTVLNKRATRLPPTTAVVHIYSVVNATTVGPRTVKHAYFWGLSRLAGASELTATSPAHDSNGGAVFNGISNPAMAGTEDGSTVNGGATFNVWSNNGAGAVVNGGAVFNGGISTDVRGYNFGVVNGGAVFNRRAQNNGTVVLNSAVVNGGAVFNDSSSNRGIVNGAAVFNDLSYNSSQYAEVNDGAEFFDSSQNRISATVNGGAIFWDGSLNDADGTVNGGAVFHNSSKNNRGPSGPGVVNDGATFNDTSENIGIVNDGGTFNGSSKNKVTALYGAGTVNGGAVFNDSACSERVVGNFAASPCSRKFVTHPTDLPTCNGTAPDGCANFSDTCGCG